MSLLHDPEDLITDSTNFVLIETSKNEQNTSKNKNDEEITGVSYCRYCNQLILNKKEGWVHEDSKFDFHQAESKFDITFTILGLRIILILFILIIALFWR